MTYLAFVLDDASRAHLLQAVPPKFEKVIAHHVTIIFPHNKPAEQLMRAAFADMMSKEMEAEVVRHCIGEHIEAVGISFNGTTMRPLGGYYHVTVSLEPPAKPVDSNKLFADDAPVGTVSSLAIKPFRLTGSLQLVD
jgi:hypothetical protein